MTSELKQINSPIYINGKKINNRIHLAPMASLGHIAYRELLDSYGGFGLMFTEMCSAKALPSENPKYSKVFRWRESELEYLICQIFGAEPDEMARGAQRVESEGFFGVDINFGCSASGICKKGCGAEVLRDPKRAVAIVKEVRNAVDIPVSVKYRTGWEDNPQFPVDMAKRFEDAGCDMLTFHPRVAPDRRRRKPNWSYIKLVKEAVSIPVFGNGDVFSRENCYKMFDETLCDGALLGRIAISKPWIFKEISDGFDLPDTKYKECAKKMIELIEHYFDETTGIKLFKKFAIYFAANFKYGHAIYTQLTNGNNYDTLKSMIDEIFETTPEITKTPNMNMFI